VPTEINLSKISHSYSTLIIDLLAQVVNLIVTVTDENKKIQKDKEKPLARGSRGSGITVRALSSSIVVLQFTTLEAIVNSIAEAVVHVHGQIEGATKVRAALSQVELDFLVEKRTLFDPRSAKVVVQNNAYSSTLDKLSIVPTLLAKAFGQSFVIDKSGSGWQKVRELKDLRDALTHVRLDRLLPIESKNVKPDVNNVPSAVPITNKQLFSGSEAIRWYSREIKNLCEETALKEFVAFGSSAAIWEVFCYLHMLNLHESCGLTKKEFAKLYPSPVRKKFDKYGRI
jgi:hypothetical protein